MAVDDHNMHYILVYDTARVVDRGNAGVVDHGNH